MSAKIETITIEPPVGMSYPAARQEILKTEIYTCTVCYGKGGKYYDQHSLHGERWEPCSLCKGSGQIQGIITIDWGETGEPKNDFKNGKTKAKLRSKL